MNTETIVSIAKVDGYKDDTFSTYTKWAGYLVATSEQEIMLLIGDYQNCCEDWGYLWTNDKPEEFIGATLQEIRITDDQLTTTALDKKHPRLNYRGDDVDKYEHVMFVSLYTDRGVLQFVAYNAHNGYYSHPVTIWSNQLQHTDSL